MFYFPLFLLEKSVLSEIVVTKKNYYILLFSILLPLDTIVYRLYLNFYKTLQYLLEILREHKCKLTL